MCPDNGNSVQFKEWTGGYLQFNYKKLSRILFRKMKGGRCK